MTISKFWNLHLEEDDLLTLLSLMMMTSHLTDGLGILIYLIRTSKSVVMIFLSFEPVSFWFH